MSKTSRNLIILVTVGFVLLTLTKSFYLARKYGVVDLRTRIVGTRLMTTEHSPYFYKWDPADGERYLDPVDEAGRRVNGNVVTPAVMTVMYPLSLLEYPKIVLLWTILQVLAGFGIIFLLFRANSIPETIVRSSLIVLGFICSDYWFYNIENGQMYLFYTFLFALMYRCYVSNLKHREFISGFIGGLFILFRPFAAVIGLGFLLHGKRKWLLGCAAGLVLGSLLFVVPQISRWQDYRNAMTEYIRETMGNASTNLNTAEPLKPVVIEGATNLREYKGLDLGRLDIIYHALGRFGIKVSFTQCIVLYAIVVLILSAFFWRMKKKISSPQTLFLFGFLVFLLAELFIPAPRQVYNVIQWMFPLSLIYLGSKSYSPVLLVLIASLLILHNFPFAFAQHGKIAELSFLLLTVYAIFFPPPVKKNVPAIN